MKNESWNTIFEQNSILNHNFDESPFVITADQIKEATKEFNETSAREPRILCKHDTREDRPDIFVKNGLFLLPTLNGEYVIIRGEGYVDIPPIGGTTATYISKLDFQPDTSKVGNSEMQHLDFAYATSLVRTFVQDDSLVLTIRGRKYTPTLSFTVGSHEITAESVQVEVDAGYEGKEQIVLVEAKNSKTTNVIIRQLFYPFQMWRQHTKKTIRTLFFEKRGKLYSLWEFGFDDPNNYNSITLKRSHCFEIVWQ
ncbi:MAG: hypothetical protein LBI05_00955 [Planctomycetaceae bacterium]|jgi:hypothetical protein|nr:hypothetical protein [Planctomycetaceae bacterium]